MNISSVISSQSHIAKMTIDGWATIFSFCEGSTLQRIGQVCHAWRTIIQDSSRDFIWAYANRRLGCEKPLTSWKQQYGILKNWQLRRASVTQRKVVTQNCILQAGYALLGETPIGITVGSDRKWHQFDLLDNEQKLEPLNLEEEVLAIPMNQAIDSLGACSHLCGTVLTFINTQQEIVCYNLVNQSRLSIKLPATFMSFTGLRDRLGFSLFTTSEHIIFAHRLPAYPYQADVRIWDKDGQETKHLTLFGNFRSMRCTSHFIVYDRLSNSRSWNLLIANTLRSDCPSFDQPLVTGIRAFVVEGDRLAVLETNGKLTLWKEGEVDNVPVLQESFSFQTDEKEAFSQPLSVPCLLSFYQEWIFIKSVLTKAFSVWNITTGQKITEFADSLDCIHLGDALPYYSITTNHQYLVSINRGIYSVYNFNPSNPTLLSKPLCKGVHLLVNPSPTQQVYRKISKIFSSVLPCLIYPVYRIHSFFLQSHHWAKKVYTVGLHTLLSCISL